MRWAMSRSFSSVSPKRVASVVAARVRAIWARRSSVPWRRASRSSWARASCWGVSWGGDMGPPWRLGRWISGREDDPSLCVQRFRQLSRRPHGCRGNPGMTFQASGGRVAYTSRGADGASGDLLVISFDQIEYASLTDVGVRRSHNQDSFAVHLAGDAEHWQKSGHLFLVADGMGGHAVGEKASELAA